MASGVEPATAVGWGVFARWYDLIAANDSRFRPFAPLETVDDRMAELEAATVTSMWNMQRHWSIRAMRDDEGLEARSVRKGVELRFVLPRRVVARRCPLAAGYYSHLRVAPVAQPLLISDGRFVLVGDPTGESVWCSEDTGVVSQAIRLYEAVWVGAEPAVAEGEEPPFTTRMVQVAFRLVDGATDREIARSIGVSERTVSADVREMSRRLGARSRAHAIAVIAGLEGR